MADMGVVNRFQQIAQIIGLLTILGATAMAGNIAYFWWDSRQTAQEYDFDTETETGGVSIDESGDGAAETGGDSTAA